MNGESNEKIPVVDNKQKSIFKRWWFWIGLLLVIVLLVVGYVMATEKKNKEIDEEKQQKKEAGLDFEWPSTTAKYITAVPVDLTQIDKISKYRSCAGHVRDGFSFEKNLETDRSMKHYFLPTSEFGNTNDAVKLFAPFDGIVLEVIPEKDPVTAGREHTGLGIHLGTQVDPNAMFGFGHLYLAKDYKKGDKVKAGELVGYAAVGCGKGGGCDFDIDLDTIGGTSAYKEREVLDSIFDHMTPTVLAEFAKYGLTPKNTKVTKEYRDAHPCIYEGENKSYSPLGVQSNQDSWISLGR
jgi:hypothetical protein